MLQLDRFARDAIACLRNWAVPPLCLLCEREQASPGGCCAACWGKLRFISRPYCEVLGTPFSYDLGQGALSAPAIADPPPFSRLRSAVLYDEHARRLVTALKYSDRLDLAPWLANWMLRAGAELLAEAPLLIPLPLHPTRLIARRYNQSAELVRHMAARGGHCWAGDLLIRIRRTRQQVGLSGSERDCNVRGAFYVPPAARPRIKGRRLLLVDDVYTSGASVNAATRALKRGGAGAVDVLTFARVETAAP